ncbi:hypothetical protein IM816_00840 [Luteibacter flocculans]|uniref:Uncharacterized protein n=1 Tax=Luteibacter flocculans TaxID=2780091 RepID=A0ABY4T198_9GAMM|nr:hypothetical protein [Luteibacter flocculans]URL58718.1 hypothetical protein IM816_00840 [Luteibacter flocculans]
MDHKAPHHSQASATVVRFSRMEYQSIRVPQDLPDGVGTIAASDGGWMVSWEELTGFPHGKYVLNNVNTIVPGPGPDKRAAVIDLAAPASSLKFRIAAFAAGVSLMGADGKVIWKYSWDSNEKGPYLFEKSFAESFVKIRLEGALACGDIQLNVDPTPAHKE